MTAPDVDTSLRLAFYGDDFTGATDALEVLAFAGLRCALFLEVPSPQALRTLGPFDAIGIAGDSRAMTPDEMAVHLPPVLQALAELPVPWVHYKVCSTFDSSPAIGSIGQVMALAQRAFGPATMPIVAGTPALGRYCVFGNLFARSGTDGQVYRLDRHPTMALHPVTPMAEADLIRHLGLQTTLPIARFPLPLLDAGRKAMDSELHRLADSDAAAILFDTFTPEHLTEVGRLLERLAHGTNRPRFAVGSSGLEYALTQWWRTSDRLPPLEERHAHFEPAEAVLAVSGSASPLSALQIDTALAAGFVDLPVPAAELTASADWQAQRDALIEACCQALQAGRSVMMHTARGPHDPRIETLLAALESAGQTREQARHAGGRLLGQRLGQVVDAVLRRVSLHRLLLSGGDTSSRITQVLAPQALRIEARLAPGAPLCRVISTQAHLKHLQIALKGGQMGTADFFVQALRGRPAQPHPNLVTP